MSASYLDPGGGAAGIASEASGTFTALDCAAAGARSSTGERGRVGCNSKKRNRKLALWFAALALQPSLLLRYYHRAPSRRRLHGGEFPWCENIKAGPQVVLRLPSHRRTVDWSLLDAELNSEYSYLQKFKSSTRAGTFTTRRRQSPRRRRRPGARRPGTPWTLWGPWSSRAP